MNDEERRAIEELKRILKYWRTIVDIEDDVEREIEMNCYSEEMPFNQIKILLNLIEKQQKENKEWQIAYQQEKDEQFDLIKENLRLKNELENIEKLQKENKELKDYINRLDKLNAEDFYFKHEAIPKSKIEKIVYQLEQDEVNITKKYKKGKGLNCYLSAIDRVRIRAYRTKTKEIKERIQELLN